MLSFSTTTHMYIAAEDENYPVIDYEYYQEKYNELNDDFMDMYKKVDELNTNLRKANKAINTLFEHSDEFDTLATLLDNYECYAFDNLITTYLENDGEGGISENAKKNSHSWISAAVHAIEDSRYEVALRILKHFDAKTLGEYRTSIFRGKRFETELTLLHIAALINDTQPLYSILEMGIDPSITNDNHESFLYNILLRDDAIEVFEHLNEMMNTFDENDKRKIEFIDFLKHTDTDFDNIITRAIKYSDNVELIKYLFKLCGAKPQHFPYGLDKTYVEICREDRPFMLYKIFTKEEVNFADELVNQSIFERPECLIFGAEWESDWNSEIEDDSSDYDNNDNNDNENEEHNNEEEDNDDTNVIMIEFPPGFEPHPQPIQYAPGQPRPADISNIPRPSGIRRISDQN